MVCRCSNGLFEVEKGFCSDENEAAYQADCICRSPETYHGLRPLIDQRGGLLCVPMPHTSGLAWNRKAKDGRRWSRIGEEQVQLAVNRARVYV